MSRAALGVLVAGICALVAIPLGYLILRAVEARGVRAAILRPRTAELALGTLTLTAVVTAVCMVVGTGLAYAAVRIAGGRPLMVGLLAAPLAVPSYVSGFAWTQFTPAFHGFWAAVLVMSAACYPLVLLPVAAALASSGRSMEDAARTLGRGPLRTFLTVTARRIRPAALGGALLAALYVLGDFGGPASVRFETFTVGIYNAYNGAFDRTLPAVYSLLLIAAALVLAVAERLTRRTDAPALASVDRVPSAYGPVARCAAWAVMAAALGVALAAPVYSLIRAITRSQRVAERGSGDLLSWLWPDLYATLYYSVWGAVVVTVLALPIALFTARPKRLGAGVVESFSYLGYTLPGITVGLAFVFVGVRLGPGFYLSSDLLIACYAVLFLPLAVAPVRAGLDATSASLSEVAHTLGAGPWATLWRVRLPLVLPGIAAGAMLAGLAIAKELPATLLLKPIGVRTLATHMWSLNANMATGEAAVLGLVLIVVAAVPTAALSALLLTKGSHR